MLPYLAVLRAFPIAGTTYSVIGKVFPANGATTGKAPQDSIKKMIHFKQLGQGKIRHLFYKTVIVISCQQLATACREFENLLRQFIATSIELTNVTAKFSRANCQPYGRTCQFPGRICQPYGEIFQTSGRKQEFQKVFNQSSNVFSKCWHEKNQFPEEIREFSDGKKQPYRHFYKFSGVFCKFSGSSFKFSGEKIEGLIQ